jgi:hypothetical protein
VPYTLRFLSGFGDHGLPFFFEGVDGSLKILILRSLRREAFFSFSRHGRIVAEASLRAFNVNSSTKVSAAFKSANSASFKTECSQRAVFYLWIGQITLQKHFAFVAPKVYVINKIQMA